MWSCYWQRGARSVLTREEARELAGKIRDGLPVRLRQQLKAIHVMEKLHNGHMTIRVHMTPQTADDPEAWIFAAHEI